MESKLVDGRIPPHTECPFKVVCTSYICHHTGEDHEAPFSCGLARAHDTTLRYNSDMTELGAKVETRKGVVYVNGEAIQ